MDQVYFQMRRIVLFLSTALMLALESHAGEKLACAATVTDLRVLMADPAFPLKWEETTMGDGNPLLVSIREKKGLLLLDFTKTREGLWAQSTGAICQTGAGLEISFSAEQIRLGRAASWLLQLSLVNGGTFKLTRIGSENLKIATTGWSGIFVPAK